MRYWSPPSWMRHFVPWAALHWFADRYGVCWSAIVMWKMGYGWREWTPCRSCFNLDHPDQKYHYDYCGTYTSGPEPLVRVEREA